VRQAQSSYLTRICGLWLGSSVFAAVTKKSAEGLNGGRLHSRYSITEYLFVVLVMFSEISASHGEIEMD
jgi:hypothetical protein